MARVFVDDDYGEIFKNKLNFVLPGGVLLSSALPLGLPDLPSLPSLLDHDANGIWRMKNADPEYIPLLLDEWEWRWCERREDVTAESIDQVLYCLPFTHQSSISNRSA